MAASESTSPWLVCPRLHLRLYLHSRYYYQVKKHSITFFLSNKTSSRAHEGYLDQGIMVKDSKLLRSHYTKTRQMKVDILSIFPTDLLYLVFDNTCHEVILRLGFWVDNKLVKMMPCLVIVRLNRLLR